MTTLSVYPVICTHDVDTTATWYRHHFGFEVTFSADWYVSLRLDTHELAVLDRAHPTIPAAFRHRTANGVLVNVEVDDVDAVWRRVVVDGGVEPVLVLRDEPFGQRHFIVADPNGVLVDVITPIPPAAEYAAAFDTTEETA